MFIVIEGTDASGKSTLYEAVNRQLEKRFPDKGIYTFHKGRPVEETRRWALKEYVTSIEDNNWFDSVGLSDRWHWGEVTYAPIFRPHTNNDGYGLLGQAGWRWTELFLQSRGVAQFWLWQSIETIQKRLEQRGDDFVEAKDLQQILDQYHLANAVSHTDYTLTPQPDSMDDISELASFVIQRALEREERTRVLEPFPYYIGPELPKAILVGDERNIVKRYGEETKLPFMPVDGNSAEYLLTALPEEAWKAFGIVNINDGDNKESFEDLWTTLGCPRVIVLGRLAEKTLASIGMHESHYDVLPHPQYVRRFFNKKKEEYGQVIERFAWSVPNEEDQKWILR